MPEIGLSGLDGLEKEFQKLLSEFPEKRAALVQKVGGEIKALLDSEIGGIGKVQRWQVVHIGSRGGYAAVRPMGSSEGAGSGKNSPGAITNYIENGHRTRQPGGGAKYYKPQIKVARVPGRKFYEKTATGAQSIAIREAEAWVQELMSDWEG